MAGNERSKKPCRVAVVKQCKEDGALAVLKIYSQKDKSGKSYVDQLVLKPKDHSSLTEDSIVGRHIYIASKDSEGKYKAIFGRNLKETDNKLTKKEHRTVMRRAAKQSKTKIRDKKRTKKVVPKC